MIHGMDYKNKKTRNTLDADNLKMNESEFDLSCVTAATISNGHAVG